MHIGSVGKIKYTNVHDLSVAELSDAVISAGQHLGQRNVRFSAYDFQLALDAVKTLAPAMVRLTVNKDRSEEAEKLGLVDLYVDLCDAICHMATKAGHADLAFAAHQHCLATCVELQPEQMQRAEMDHHLDRMVQLMPHMKVLRTMPALPAAKNTNGITKRRNEAAKRAYEAKQAEQTVGQREIVVKNLAGWRTDGAATDAIATVLAAHIAFESIQKDFSHDHMRVAAMHETLGVMKALHPHMSKGTPSRLWPQWLKENPLKSLVRTYKLVRLELKNMGVDPELYFGPMRTKATEGAWEQACRNYFTPLYQETVLGLQRDRTGIMNAIAKAANVMEASKVAMTADQPSFMWGTDRARMLRARAQFQSMLPWMQRNPVWYANDEGDTRLNEFPRFERDWIVRTVTAALEYRNNHTVKGPELETFAYQLGDMMFSNDHVVQNDPVVRDHMKVILRRTMDRVADPQRLLIGKEKPADPALAAQQLAEATAQAAEDYKQIRANLLHRYHVPGIKINALDYRIELYDLLPAAPGGKKLWQQMQAMPGTTSTTKMAKKAGIVGANIVDISKRTGFAARETFAGTFEAIHRGLAGSTRIVTQFFPAHKSEPATAADMLLHPTPVHRRAASGVRAANRLLHTHTNH